MAKSIGLNDDNYSVYTLAEFINGMNNEKCDTENNFATMVYIEKFI